MTGAGRLALALGAKGVLCYLALAEGTRVVVLEPTCDALGVVDVARVARKCDHFVPLGVVLKANRALLGPLGVQLA